MTKRANPPNKSPFEYYQRAIFLPYRDTVLSQLGQRFSKHKDAWEGLFSLLPEIIRNEPADSRKIEKLNDIYCVHLPGNLTELTAEYKGWVAF